MSTTSPAYALGERLYEGYRATVYRAVRVADGRAVALKVLDPKNSRPRDVERLRNELELGRVLKGLPVVEALAGATFRGLPALELEDFHGEALDRLAGTPMPIDVFLPLAERIAVAVAEIHERGLVHKDLKPGNILLNRETGEIRIADFCIAARMVREPTAAQSPRLIEGSLPYVSPEQTGRMNRAMDSRSDLYSLGVTFYQLLTGRLPFEASDAIGWVYCHLARKPTPPQAVRPSIPEAISDIVLKLLAKVPDERYQSAAGLAHDLRLCLDQWRKTRHIVPFPYAQSDASDRFLIPQKLYGRAAERATLEAAFERVVATGRPELVLVSGYAGIGKSSVVNELHQPIARKRGVFVAGKFEQYRRDVPYFTLVQTFREVMLDILAEPAATIGAWRKRIQAALGDTGQLIVELIPEVELVLGPQPPVPELSLGEAENRLRMVLRAFVGTFATQGQPLTLFLDDLQWADPASLKLLVDLVTQPTARRLLVIGAYRDDEVGPTHPLMPALAEARAQGGAIHALVLGPLPETDLDELIADTVQCTPAEAAPLARLVREKTGGNPFFVVQFLTALHRQGLISFDHASRRWRWELARIRAQGYSDNIVGLMVEKLRDLPYDTQEALKVAACLGANVDADTLALVFEGDAADALRAAVEEDLLLRVEGHYRFPHDRVQEAAYALIPDSEKPLMHLTIGRRLLAHAAPAETEDRIFDIVNQLNKGAPLITSVEERERVAALDLAAGNRARRSTAFASALQYFNAGAALLGRGEDRWIQRYDLAFALELHRAECEFLTGALEEAEQRLGALTHHAASISDAAAVAVLQVDLCTTSGNPQRAVEACLAYLRRVGITWSPHPTDAEVKGEFARMWERLGGRPIAALSALPAMTEPVWRATVDVLTIATAPASFTDENLCCLIVARAANLSFEHGNSEGSSQTYVLLGEILGAYFGDYDAAFRFGKLGLDLMDSRGPLRLKARVYFCFAQMVNPWRRHFRSSIELQQRAFEAGLQSGDLQTASYVQSSTITLLLAAGEPLREVERRTQEGLAFVQKVRYGLVGEILTVQLRLIRMLRGATPRFACFDGDGFDEGELERRLDADPSLSLAAGWYWIRKLQGRFLALEYGDAVRAAARAERFLWTARAFPEVADLRFFAGLAHAAAYDTAADGARDGHLRAVAAAHEQLVTWARTCRESFENRALLVGAEYARLRGAVDEAARLYEDAIRSARDNGFVHNEAIAYETAARFYRARRFPIIADAYLREARERYARWGADGKVRDLERRHPQLVEPRAPGPATTVTLQPDQLDLLSVVKASQTISGVMLREHLLPTLLRLLLESGGARRALVFFARAASDGGLELAAEIGSDEGPVVLPATGAPNYPASLVAYAQRTRERVVLADAAADAGRFAGDPYLIRARPRAVLCLPIRRQAEIVALVYLENDLVPGAFTPERLLVLELLGAQAAISIENALLLESEHRGRMAAEAAEARALLLSEATEVMTATLDLHGQEALGALTRVCVRAFADWAIIDLVDGDRTVRLAGSHRDPEKEPLLRELAERYPARGSSRAPATLVLETGKPVLISHIGEAEWRASAVDERHIELVRQLGTRSTIVVPLIVRDVMLGALTLASSTPGRYTRADVELAAEIARRAALAIDNARLLQETQRAVQQRDDFLSIASHELRTPMTSLKMTVELLSSAKVARVTSPAVLDRRLGRVRHSAERLERLTDELLDVTRIERGRLDLDPVDVDLGRLVRQTVEDMRLELTNAGCRVELDGDETVAGVWDRSRLQQVVTNLVSNALKFGRGHPIEIRIWPDGEHAQLSVRDHGIGIEPSRQHLLFNRFERAGSATNYGGLGLGLYIARKIVEAHGGDLRVESALGLGAAFTLKLPWVAPHPATGEAPPPV